MRGRAGRRVGAQGRDEAFASLSSTRRDDKTRAPSMPDTGVRAVAEGRQDWKSS